MKTDKMELFTTQSFHFFVSSVLRQIAAKEKKEIDFEATLPIDVTSSKGWRFDAFDAIALNGLNNIDGPIIFEFKYNLRQTSLSAILSSLNKQIERAGVYTELTVVLITNFKFDIKQESSMNYSFNENLNQRNLIFKIWGEDVIKNWIYQYPIDFSNAISKYGSLQEVENISDEITDSNFNNKSLNNAKTVKYIIGSEDSFALVLGAGVSVDPGAKSWKELLEYFEIELVKNGLINERLKLCNKIGDSNLITAQLCKELYKSVKDYFWAIHNGLYEGRKPLNTDFALYHVANIVKNCEHKHHFRVLTYNYDDYLESYLKKINLSYNILYDANSAINKYLSIYHVHGFLPNVKYKSYMLERHQESIYLTEANYNELYNHPYSWQISSQLSFFRENTCLFIGCSLTDPNIRRLLEMTKKENRTHFAILTKDRMTVKDLIRASNHFARLGIEIIWVENYTDISSQLRELY